MHPSLGLALALVLVLAQAAHATDAPGKEEQPCARSCHTINCDNVGIRYGRYCGVGHGGCPGVKPCDPVDRCCMKHDACVEKHSVFNQKCHSDFLKCLDRHHSRDHEGFAPNTCPYSLVIPTMRAGIQMAMMFTGGHDGSTAAATLSQDPFARRRQRRTRLRRQGEAWQQRAGIRDGGADVALQRLLGGGVG